MTVERQARQHALPLFIDRLENSGAARALKSVALTRSAGTAVQHDEVWLQKLIFLFPQVLPVYEIEPGFSRLIPVCLELPTPAGYIDNFYVTESGDLVIVECKLWRNPEARREVVAQIIDYAHSLASWRYSDLEAAIRKSSIPEGKTLPRTLFQLVEDESRLGEEDFVDAVSQNLRLGRILLLIVGDGIREGVESLAGYLQMHAGFHFTLGIVEMPVYELPQGGFIVQPRVLARTVNIERGIVKIADNQALIEPPTIGASQDISSRRTSISQERMFEELAKIEPELPKMLQTFRDRAADIGVVLEAASKSLQFRWRGLEELTVALGGINEDGNLVTSSICWVPDSIGQIDLAHEYLEKIASLVGGSVRRTPTPSSWYVVSEGTNLPLAMKLLAQPNEWLALIEDYVGKLKAAAA